MKRFLIWTLVLITIIAVIFFFYFNNIKKESTAQQNTNDTAAITRTSESQNLDTTNTNTNTNTNANTNTSTNTYSYTETEISSFSTKIYTKEDSRQNNLSITCSILDGKIVKSGETFSFTNTIGPSTSSKGYEEADIFDSNGNKKKGYGGGNCQVSSTLYNAVLNTSGLSVIERHEHSNKVPYVPENKDAAVAYGSIDFKFRNDNDFDIRINCSTDGNYVYVTLYRI